MNMIQEQDGKQMHKGKRQNRTVLILVFVGLIIISYIWGKTCATSAAHHSDQIQYLEDKQHNAMALTAGASATAFLISLIPDDTATPNANQIANIGKDFLIVLAAVTAEQYMLTITGLISFYIIIPIALLLMMLFHVFRVQWGSLGYKLLFFGIALYAAVPLSIKISGLIEDTYKETVNATLEASEELKKDFHYEEIIETEIETMPETEVQEDQSWLDSVKGTIAGAGAVVGDAVGSVAQGTKDAVDAVTGFVQDIPDLPRRAADLANRYIEAFVIMLVTTCIIPIFTLMGLVWMINLIIGTDFRINGKV